MQEPTQAGVVCLQFRREGPLGRYMGVTRTRQQAAGLPSVKRGLNCPLSASCWQLGSCWTAGVGLVQASTRAHWGGPHQSMAQGWPSLVELPRALPGEGPAPDWHCHVNS